MLTAADFLEDARTFHLTTEATEGALKRLAFSDSDTGHNHHLPSAQQRGLPWGERGAHSSGGTPEAQVHAGG